MRNTNTLFTTTGVTDSDRMLHTPGEFAKKNLLYVQEIGKLKSLQPHKSQRQNLDSFLFLMVLNGEGTVSIEETSYSVKKGNCALINCMSNYSHESSSEQPWELMWVHFNGNIAGDYFKLFMEQNEQQNVFKTEDLNKMQIITDHIMKYQKEKDLAAELLSGDLLLQLINNCLLTVIHHSKENHEAYMLMYNEIRENINSHYCEDNLMKTFSEKYGMEEDSLDNNFYKAYGITLRDYILNRRFTAAKELLRFTAKPIDKILIESGIKNDDLFRRLFWDGEGMTAEEYRMKWSQWVK